MTRRLCLTTLIVATGLFTGCSLLKKPAAKPDQGLTGEVEGDFKVRWMEKRAAELVAQGQTADAARAQAVAEFKERYGYTGAAQK